MASASDHWVSNCLLFSFCCIELYAGVAITFSISSAIVGVESDTGILLRCDVARSDAVVVVASTVDTAGADRGVCHLASSDASSPDH